MVRLLTVKQSSETSAALREESSPICQQTKGLLDTSGRKGIWGLCGCYVCSYTQITLIYYTISSTFLTLLLTKERRIGQQPFLLFPVS